MSKMLLIQLNDLLTDLLLFRRHTAFDLIVAGFIGPMSRFCTIFFHKCNASDFLYGSDFSKNVLKEYQFRVVDFN